MLDKTLLVEGQLRPMLQDDTVLERVKQVGKATAKGRIDGSARWIG